MKDELQRGEIGLVYFLIAHSFALLSDRSAVWRDRMVNSLYLLTYPIRRRGDEKKERSQGDDSSHSLQSHR
jgi:hypothetical protein